MVDFALGNQKVLSRDDKGTTLTSATFVVECEGKTAVFSELGGINSEVEQTEYMEAGPKGPTYGRFLGKAKPPTVSLKRSMTTGSDTSWIWGWHALARTLDKMAYKDTTLKLFAAGQGETPAKTYYLSNAIPTKVEIAGMKAGGTEVVIQTLTLMCDAIEEAP